MSRIFAFLAALVAASFMIVTGAMPAKAIPNGGRSCKVLVNGYWDSVGPRDIKVELARCIGLRSAPVGEWSLMSRTNPAPKLTDYDLRDLRSLYRMA